MKVLAGVFAAVLVVTACTSQPPGGATAQGGEADRELTAPVSITLWHAQTGSLARALSDLVAQFNSTNGQGISVVLVYQGNAEQLAQKTQGAIQAGTLPELVVGPEAVILEYQRSGVVLDLDPYLGSPRNGLDAASRDDLFRTYLDANRSPQIGGKLHGFPFARSLLVMYENDDVLRASGQASPRTWEEFEKVARAVTARTGDGKVTRHGWAVPLSASVFLGWVISRGGQLMSEGSAAVAWDGREGIEALKLFQKLLHEGIAYVPRGFDQQADFGGGKVAFVHDASGDRPFFASAFPRERRVAWSVVSLPQADAGRPKTVQHGTNLSAFRSTPPKQLASWLFMKWFTGKEQTAEWAVRSGYQPVRASAADTGALRAHWASDTQGKQAFDLTATAVPEPSVRGQQDIRTVIEDLLKAVATGKATDVEQAVKEAGIKANQILKDAR